VCKDDTSAAFAETDNVNMFQNFGVDNVSLDVNAQQAPIRSRDVAVFGSG